MAVFDGDGSMKRLSYHMTLKLFFEEKSFGPGPMQLLQGVEETGSLHQSAANMRMAYSKAWKILRTLEKDWGVSILYRHSGGAKGGGSALTPQGKLILQQYEAMVEEVGEAAALSFEKHFGQDFFEKLKEKESRDHLL